MLEKLFAIVIGGLFVRYDNVFLPQMHDDSGIRVLEFLQSHADLISINRGKQHDRGDLTLDFVSLGGSFVYYSLQVLEPLIFEIKEGAPSGPSCSSLF